MGASLGASDMVMRVEIFAWYVARLFFRRVVEVALPQMTRIERISRVTARTRRVRHLALVSERHVGELDKLVVLEQG
jgi:hypothetical protein